MFRLSAVFTLSALALTATASPCAKRDGQQFSGRATFFEVGLGACGLTNVDSDLIVALAAPTYAGGAHCNQQIEINYNGKTSQATVRDMCPSCAAGDLDMSPGLFDLFETPDKGTFQMTWNFV